MNKIKDCILYTYDVEQKVAVSHKFGDVDFVNTHVPNFQEITKLTGDLLIVVIFKDEAEALYYWERSGLISPLLRLALITSPTKSGEILIMNRRVDIL